MIAHRRCAFSLWPQLFSFSFLTSASVQFEYRPASERINNEKAPVAHMEMRKMRVYAAFHASAYPRGERDPTGRGWWVGGAHAHVYIKFSTKKSGHGTLSDAMSETERWVWMVSNWSKHQSSSSIVSTAIFT